MANEGIMFMQEACLIRWHDELLHIGVGDAASVEFPFDKVWPLAGRDPSTLVFLHSHPPGFPGFSHRDHQCYRALRMAFGRDFAFAVVLFGMENRSIWHINHVVPEHWMERYMEHDLELLKAWSHQPHDGSCHG
jgi:hypothetical protein